MSIRDRLFSKKFLTQEELLEALHTNMLPIIIDVRDKEIFDSGHISEAINIPLFNTYEKKIIDTLNNTFGSASQSVLAKTEEFIKPNIDVYVTQLKAIVSQREESAIKSGRSLSDLEKTILVYCWISGPYSQGFANILIEYGFSVLLLDKGYNGYANFFNSYLFKTYSFKVLGGHLGSGKTAILYELQKAGKQILDLEKCAEHSGTIFGALGKTEQTRNRSYMVSIGLQLSFLNPDKSIWIEEKTRKLGKYLMQNRSEYILDSSKAYKRLSQNSFWEQIKTAPIYRLELPIELRLKRIIAEYSQFNINELKEKTIKLIKHLGHERYALVIEALESDNFHKSAEMLLKYYDSYYNKTTHKRNAGKEIRIVLQEDSPEITAKMLIKEVYKDEL